MTRRRILVVLTDPPLPFGSAAARWYSVLCKELVARGHHVTTFAACFDEEEIAATQKIFPRPQYDMRCYILPPWEGVAAKLESFRRPHSYLFSPQMKREIREEMARGFDVLHLEQVWAAWAAPANPAHTLINVHYLFEIDMEGHTPASLKERAVDIRSRQATRSLLRKFPHISTLTSRLTDAVRKISPASNVSTVPLGLDTSLYPFVERRGENGRTNPVVGLIGSFNWQPSYAAGRKLVEIYWPEIKKRIPAAKLLIVGRSASSAFADYLSAADVTIRENVADIIPYFMSIDVLLYAPDHGSGMKVKVMEAFALGVSVVTNGQGVEGLPAEDGVHAGISEDDSGIINRAVGLLSSPERRQTQTIAARRLIESYCDPKAVVGSLESLYSNMMGLARRTS